MSEEKSCDWCHKPFTPTNRNHGTCSNLCVVRRYQHKQRLRKLLRSLCTPEQLTATEIFMSVVASDQTAELEQ
jgi:hypothetical protein